ncbi:MAG: hypothetical protein OES09_14115, partial [Gammaproteobacteria bacterium]|nr:hypothetical protein [Gammaproteobacteria bacterium]
HLIEQFASASSDELKNARDYLMLYQLSSREEFVLHPIGLAKKDCKGFQLHPQRFTTAFSNRLQSLLRPLRDGIHTWRRELDHRGRIAWPLRANGILKEEDRDEVFRAFRKLLIESSQPHSVAHLDETSGVNVQNLLTVLERMQLSPQARAAGYQDGERCGLFSTLDADGQPQLPAFLYHLCDYVMGGNEWSYDAACREWFWGYTWEGAKPVETYVQWMALLCDLGFAQESATGTRKNDTRYKLIDRSAIRGLLTEAQNWLSDPYPRIVDRMKQVFGEGKVQDYFAPMSDARPGTKTRDAKQRLDSAATCIRDLDVSETSWKEARDDDAQLTKFVECSQKRLQAMEGTQFVFEADAYHQLQRDDSMRQLNFENDDQPLWRRIGQANLFVDFVMEAKQRIIARIDHLSQELHDAIHDMPGFPIQAYTRSLDKISNILSGAIGANAPEGSTQTLQNVEPGTLGHALKELRVDQATDRLQQLADEVGIELESHIELPLAEISGRIIQSFRGLVREYRLERERLADLANAINRITADLTDAPDDFSYPPKTPPLKELQMRPEFIESELSETLADDIEDLISEHDRTSRLGNFRPLMDATKELLNSSKWALGELGGHVNTVENVIAAYRRRLLGSSELRDVEQAYNALLRVQGRAPEKTLDMSDLEKAGSLKSAKALVVDRCTQWPVMADKFLEGTDVSFELWKHIVAAISAGQPLTLSGEQIENLVSKGYLQVTYRLGGPQ